MRMQLASIATAVLFAWTSTAHAQQAMSFPRADGALTPVIVYDTAGSSCPPLALISPGAGGDEKGLVYLGEALQHASPVRQLLVEPLRVDLSAARDIFEPGLVERPRVAEDTIKLDRDSSHGWMLDPTYSCR